MVSHFTRHQLSFLQRKVIINISVRDWSSSLPSVLFSCDVLYYKYFVVDLYHQVVIVNVRVLSISWLPIKMSNDEMSLYNQLVYFFSWCVRLVVDWKRGWGAATDRDTDTRLTMRLTICLQTIRDELHGRKHEKTSPPVTSKHCHCSCQPAIATPFYYLATFCSRLHLSYHWYLWCYVSSLHFVTLTPSLL